MSEIEEYIVTQIANGEYPYSVKGHSASSVNNVMMRLRHKIGANSNAHLIHILHKRGFFNSGRNALRTELRMIGDAVKKLSMKL